jgi:hypothetical protein
VKNRLSLKSLRACQHISKDENLANQARRKMKSIFFAKKMSLSNLFMGLFLLLILLLGGLWLTTVQAQPSIIPISEDRAQSLPFHFSQNTSLFEEGVFDLKGSSSTLNFHEFQSIPTNGADEWEFFTIGENHYLALANWQNDSTYNLDSKIYQWNGTSFSEFQSIPTNGARDWEFFTIGSQYYLAVANSYNDSTVNIDSKIYQWNGSRFVEFQSIPTNNALDWEFFTIGSSYYLAIANFYNDSTTNIESKIYQWNGTLFSEIQTIPTSGAHYWEFFHH